MPKTFVIFQTDMFDLSWPDDDDDLNRVPWGKDGAQYFMRELKARGALPLLDEPVMGEGGWHWDVRLGGEQFVLTLQWVALGRPPEDYWVIQFRKTRGNWAALFGRKQSRADLQPICDLADEILEEEERLMNVRWLNQDEFDEMP